jgi:predicted phage terminase large subunit-like protein
VVKVNLELPEVEAMIVAEDRLDHPALIVLDRRGMGLGLEQSLRRKGLTHVNYDESTDEPTYSGPANGTGPNDSKIYRFGRAMEWIVAGRVLFPDHADWLQPFLYELFAFPNISRDDQADSMSQVIGNFVRAIYLARLEMRRRLDP